MYTLARIRRYANIGKQQREIKKQSITKHSKKIKGWQAGGRRGEGRSTIQKKSGSANVSKK